MTDQLEFFKGNFEQQPLKTYAEKAYLDYSMYVVLDRALPHVGDGLKPVQRRIVYAMSELGLSAVSKPKKSARTIGDVIGKFHPHGDSACYEAMVLMAQPFSYRYPLVDGHGNFGSTDDPRSFAAMRYTEARLTPYAKLLLSELAQGTVDWVPNFDGTMDEPTVLPARLPNLLLNGGSGIAVGMATDIPPHNMRELASACIRLLEEPKASVAALCEHLPGPDYPTDAEIITPRADLRRIYETGNGTLRMRAQWQREDDAVILTALPHQVSPAKILEQIAAQMRAKKLPMVEDLRDESDHEHPTRVVIVPRSRRVDIEALMSHLFATTDLEKSYRVNLNVIGIDGRPRVKDLKGLLSEWLSFRQTTVRRRLEHRLRKVTDRLHILEGLLTAYLNIDEVIRIIREEDEPKRQLMKQFGLSDTQAEAILELKLRYLAKLEEMKIKGEQEELESERKALEATLKSKAKLKKLIRKEITEDAEEYGDERRSPLVEREQAQAISETELAPTEPVTVVLSQKGWARTAKGHEIDPAGLNYRAGDAYLAHARGRSNETVVFLDDTGRGYSVVAHALPSARGQGEPLTGRFKAPSGAAFGGVVVGGAAEHVILASSAGYGFITSLGELHSRNKSGKKILTVPKGAGVVTPATIDDPVNDFLVCATSGGHLLGFWAEELPLMTKGKGNKLVNIPPKARKDGEVLVAVAAVPEGGTLRVHAGQRYKRLTWDDLDDYWGERAQRGRKLPQGFRHVDRLEVEAD